MALKASTMLALSTVAPSFQLPDVMTGKMISPEDAIDKKALLVMFICQHCPFVKHIQKELAKLGKDYAGESLDIIAVSSNDVANYPNDSPEKLKAMAEELGFNFPICYDETQTVAKAYTAACTPDFFLFNRVSATFSNRDRRLVYRGQLDDSRPSNNLPVTGADLRAAINATLAGEAVNSEQKPSIGCNIKWKIGNEPNYYG
jgi:peroxiredoxin